MEIFVPKFKGAEEKTYELEVVTPMFLGGADKKSAEFRIPSLKGMLRFWWRALYGKNFNNLRKMKEQEDLIFGSTNNKSSFSIEIINTEIRKSMDLPEGKKYPVFISKIRKQMLMDIFHYLSYGLYDYDRETKKNVFKKEHIMPESKIEIKIKYYDTNKIQEIENSLFALINYGGLGSRNRNGFGSLYCINSSLDIRKFFKGNLRNFTSTSEKSKLFIIKKQFDKWEHALSKLGLIYLNARLKLERKHEFDKRGLVARPIKVKGEQNVPKNIVNGRHPKSYFLHVSKVENKYTCSILFLPYDFYEKDKREEYLKVYDEMNKYINSEIEVIGNEY